MDRQKMLEAGINYDTGLARFVGKVPLYEKYLYQFVEDTHFSQLKQEMERKDYNAAFKTAHALKGVIGTLSMDRLFAAVSDVVEALRSRDIEKADMLLKRAEKEYEFIITFLKENRMDGIN